MFQNILIVIIVYAMFNMKYIINQKRTYIINNSKDDRSNEVKKYAKYLKILDCFIVFLITMLVLNTVYIGLEQTILNQYSTIFVLFFALVNIFITIIFNYKSIKKEKITTIFYYINISIIIILFIINLILSNLN